MASSLSSRESVFVNTYDPPNVPNPVDVIRDFHRVREYVSTHPNHGRRRASTTLGLNENRIRGWMNETSKPDVVRGLELARDRGWLTIDDDDPKQPNLATLVAGVFACGGIATNWVPAWLPETIQCRTRIADALMALTDGHVTRHDEEDDRPTELLPMKGASAFGRVLVAYGAPQGDKNDESVEALPDWLLDGPEESRRQAVEVFLLERGTFFESKDTVTIQTRNRRQSYREDLATLVRSVTDGRVSAGRNVVVSAEAARELGFGRGSFVRP